MLINTRNILVKYRHKYRETVERDYVAPTNTLPLNILHRTFNDIAEFMYWM